LRNRDRTIADFALAGLQRHPVAFVLDNVRSAYNVGGMFRTADTASVSEIVTCGLTPHPNGPGKALVLLCSTTTATAVVTTAHM
jgi:tRNA G18 (ribose-2'-O)-methylase SpoU